MKTLAAIVTDSFSITGKGQVIVSDRDCTALIHTDDEVKIETQSGTVFTTIVRDTLIHQVTNPAGERTPLWAIRIDNPQSLDNTEFRGAKVFSLN